MRQRHVGGPSAGVTIVEVLVSAAIMTLVLGGLWTMTTVGERTTAAAVMQADCLQRTQVLMRLVGDEIERAERVLHPGPDLTGDSLFLLQRGGAVETVELVPPGTRVVARNLSTGAVSVLASTEGTELTMSGLQFVNRDDREVQLQVVFADRNGTPVPSFTSLLGSFALRRCR